VAKVRSRHLLVLLLAMAAMLLAGCSGAVLLDPKGQVGMEEKRAIIIAFSLMCIVVVPVLVLTPIFAVKYRASHPRPTHLGKPHYLKVIDVLIWAVPAAIVVALASVSWVMTHRLDPFRPIASPERPVTVQVVALDWKWLFIYPDQRVASVNEVAFPANVPVDFYLTSDTVMNSFFIPQLGSQIYAMPGMQSQLHLIANATGSYAGIAANFSGAGFSGMQFAARAVSAQEFDGWVRAARASPVALDPAQYQRLAQPSQDNPVAYFSSVEPGLFMSIMGKYMQAR
jgi:cytochrome o ubiquinol oxidase subunit 2